MASETDLKRARDYAREALADMLRGHVFIETQISAHDQKVVDLVGQLEMLAREKAALRDESSPYRDLLQSLSKCATRNRAAFDALRLHAGDLMREGRVMADELRRFVADVLCGSARCPQFRGAPGIHPARDRLICALLEEIAGEFGLPVMRNRATVSPVSACDVLAMAMPRKARLPKTYSAMEAIWLAVQREERAAGDVPDLPADAQAAGAHAS